MKDQRVPPRNDVDRPGKAGGFAESLRTMLRDGLPMPLWLQGALEFLQSAFLSAVLVVVPLVVVWFGGGFEARALESLFKLAGQVWLVMHGVPLHIVVPVGEDSAQTLSGTMSLVPLGLALIPFFLSWRAGRRIARASYTDQLWQGIAGALVAYMLFGLITGYAVGTEDVQVNLGAAALVPLVAAGAGVVVGAYREAGSWGRLVGVDMAAWIAKASQHSRWAGSYVWAVLRAGALGYVAAMALASVVLAVNLGIHWVEISNVYQQLRGGPIGGAVLTIGQLGLMPNLAAWTLAWISGGGFTLGVGSTLSTLQTTVGPLPAVPVLAALPTGSLDSAWLFMLVPVAAGIVAGWWFLREGENHLDEWVAIKNKTRWASLAASTLALGVFIGLTAGLVSLLGSWLSGGSLGIGRLTEIGPNPWTTALMLAGEICIGAVIGYLVAPVFERDPVLDD
jgi:hypothetical protein